MSLILHVLPLKAVRTPKNAAYCEHFAAKNKKLPKQASRNC